MNKARTWLINGLLFFMALVLASALSELALRMLWPQPMGVSHHDRDGLALHWPGLVTYLPQFGQTVSFNSMGMRDREHTAARAPGVFRILLLGDSFMEALQVPFEASFPSLLERTLDTALHRPVEVVNASVSGWGTDDESHYLLSYGLKWNPDLVLIAVTLHNDLSDNLREQWHTISNDILVDQPRARASFLDYKIAQAKGFIATRFHIYQLWRRVRRRDEMHDAATRLNKHVVQLCEDPPPNEIVRGMKLTALLFERLRDVVKADGSHLALVLLPLDVQMSDSTFAAFANAANDGGQVLRQDNPQRSLTAIADHLHIPAFDLLPAFRQWTASGGDRLYLTSDGHWTRSGHRLAADRVAQWLAQSRLDDTRRERSSSP